MRLLESCKKAKSWCTAQCKMFAVSCCESHVILKNLSKEEVEEEKEETFRLFSDFVIW